MKVQVIGNPVSGGGRGRRRMQRLCLELEKRGHAVELFLTAAAGDARRCAANVHDDCDRLIVVGGDGTLNEVLNGLRDPSRIPLLQLATGTANILAHELRLPRWPPAVVDLVERGSVFRLDMGLVGDRRFLMLVSSGFDAMVTREIQRTRRGRLGYRGYVVPTLRMLARYRAPRIHVEVDGEHAATGGLVVVSNTRNYGGLFTVADRASCVSGQLDVCVLERAAVPDLLRAASRGLTTGWSRARGVTYLTARRVRLDAEAPTPVQVDGDFLGSTPVEIEVRAATVPFVVPADPR